MASAEDGHGLCEVGAKSVFGKFSDAELVAQLKGLALNPRRSEQSQSDFQALLNQAVRVRKAMAMAADDIPRRKRKLQLLLKDCSRSCFSDRQSKSKVSKGQISSNGSSPMFLLTPEESAVSFGGKIGLDAHGSCIHITFEDDNMDGAINSSAPSKNGNPPFDSDEPADCPNPNSPGNAISQEKVPSKSRVQDTPTKKKHFQPPRRPGRSLAFMSNETKRAVIPVGPRFQADLPEWIGPVKAKDSEYIFETSKWTNTRIWPNNGRRVTGTRAAGKGRSGSCSACTLPGSIECVQRHIIEERLLLLCDLAGAFFRMKLDQTGEQVAKAWKAEEQRNFQQLAIKKPMHDDGKDFLKHAFKCFPNKCRKTIMNYYFNAYLPRRMGQLTRASKKIDTDDEAEDNVKSSGQKSKGGKSSGGSQNAKNRFLRQP